MSNAIKRQHRTHSVIHQEDNGSDNLLTDMDELHNQEKIEELCRNLRQQQQQQQQQPLPATG